MNREETLKYLSLVKVAYPSAYRDADRDTLLATVEMWRSTFRDLPYPIMEAAFDSFRRHSKFPPTVAEIYDELRKIHSQAWQDMNVAAIDDDSEGIRRAAFVMEVTEPYRLKREKSRIPYNTITEAMLARSNAAMLLSKKEETV